MNTHTHCLFCKSTKLKNGKGGNKTCLKCKSKYEVHDGQGIWRKLFVLILLMAILPMVSAISITEILTPTGTTSSSSALFQYNISVPDGNLKTLTWNWDNTNYSLYDSSLVLFYNFDNRSSLGENDTFVADLSKYGNNATMQSGYLNMISGKYDGGILSNGTYTTSSQIYSNSFNNSLGLTICFWEKAEPQPGNTYQNYLTRRNTANTINDIVIYRHENQEGISFEFWAANGTNAELTGYTGTGSTVNGIWHHVCSSTTLINTTTYYDGLQVDFDTFSTFNLTNVTGRMLFYTDYNGSMDDLMVWNRSLASEEISRVYNSQLTKYDSQNNSLVINQTSLAASQNYQLCTSNQTNEVCTTIKSLNHISTLTSSFLNLKGIIKSDFYGVGLQGPTRFFGGSIDTNCDGISETVRDYAQNKADFLNGGNKITYFDASLDSYYTGFNTYWMDAEFWLNTSSCTATSNPTFARGWSVQLFSGASECINRIAGISGNYAINVTSNNVSSSAYTNLRFYTTGINFTDSLTYNASVWMRGNATVNFAFIATPSNVGYGRTTFTLNDTWQEYKIGANLSSGDNYFLVIENIGANETVNVDNLTITQNGNNFINTSYWDRSGNITNFINQMDWDYQNHITDMIIMDYTPVFIANLSNISASYCLDNESDIDYGDCMALNSQDLADISLDFYKRVDQFRNYSYVEIWNEPYGGFFEDNLPDSSSKTDFVILFNSIYKTIKSYNPNIKVIGYRSHSGNSTFDIMMFSNLTTEFNDGFSIHPYGTYTDGNVEPLTYTNNVISNCEIYGASCDFISLDEWQPNYSGKNASNGQSARYIAENAIPYVDMLNNYPSRVSMMYYHWDDTVSYFNCASRYSEYPSMWMGISEAGLDNPTRTYYPPYNVTKNFATYCPSGSTVYQSTSDDTTIKTASCKDGNKYNVIIINTDTTSKNVSVNVGSSGITQFTSNTNQVYSGSGIINLGVIDGYGVEYLSGILETYPQVCDSSNAILGGFIALLPLIVIILVVFVVLGFKYGTFEDVSMDKFLAITGGLIFLFIMLAIGIIISLSIGGCG